MVLVKNWPFFQFSIFLFFSKTRQVKKVFYDILNRKNAVLDYKNKKFKKSKNRHFSKRVNPWFCSKNGHFPSFFFANISQENVHFSNLFFRQYRPAKCLLRYSRTKKRRSRLFFKKSQNRHFSKNRFGPKMAIFPTFFFGQYGPGKCLLRYSRTKKRLVRL